MSVPVVPPKILRALRAPGQGNDTDLVEQGDRLVCPQTGTEYAVDGGIPLLMTPPPSGGERVQSVVKSFYEESPFPSYEGQEEYGDLVAKGYSNSFARGLLNAIGANKLILECGCGTGQLSNFLQLNNNQVLGVDMSLASLRLAAEHKHRNQLTRVAFAQMNLFDL